MKATNRINIYILLPIFFASIGIAKAQVTIGCGEEPLPGTILQLKNTTGITDGSANATRGLLLPRVELTDLENLFPMFKKGSGDYTGAAKVKEDIAHVGLMVYNTKEDLTLPNPIYKGVYVWNVKKWELVAK